MMSTKKCLICKKKINRKSPKAIYCSDPCKYKAYRLRDPERVKKIQEKYNKKHHKERLEIWKMYRIKSGRSKTIYNEGMLNTCIECGRRFEPDKFHPFMKFCSRNCGARYTQREWKKRNSKRVKEIMMRYDKSEKGKERRKRRYNKIKEYQKEWLKKHPEKSSEYSEAYRRKYPQRYKENRKKYEHSLKGVLANRKKSHLYRMLIKKNYNHNKLIPIITERENKCPLCGSDYGKQWENMELGHIFPLSKYHALAGDSENLLPICKKCNRKMRDNVLTDYCIKNNLPIPSRVIYYIKKQRKLLDF